MEQTKSAGAVTVRTVHQYTMLNPPLSLLKASLDVVNSASFLGYPRTGTEISEIGRYSFQDGSRSHNTFVSYIFSCQVVVG